MRRFILTIIFACFSLTMFGTDDLFFAYLKHVPKGDTPVDSVRFESYYGEGVTIDEAVELVCRDRHYSYYNLFYPELINDSTYTVYKARVRLPKGYDFEIGLHEYGGATFFCFGNRNEWFVALMNFNKDEDGESSGIDVFDIEEAPDAKWLWYNSIAQGEVLSAVHRWLLQRQFWRFMWMSHDIPEKDYSYGLCKRMKNVLYFMVKDKHRDQGVEMLSSFEMINSAVNKLN